MDTNIAKIEHVSGFPLCYQRMTERETIERARKHIEAKYYGTEAYPFMIDALERALKRCDDD